ncbi:MAG: metallophosphoesterase [Ignavibacteriales bacterium]|nr:metallophosphoesterase [Ignavibacteriales bacterium]
MVAVIGDVHGCYFTLETLYTKVVTKYNNIPVLSVGDLVDRGNYSFEVVNFFIDNVIRFTPGNHDYMFYDFFKKPESLFARAWIYNGNEATMRSYSSKVDMISSHLNFIRSAPLFYDLPDCFISHAGIADKYKSKLPKNFREDLRSVAPLIESIWEEEDGILWSRQKLLNMGKLQLVGHSKQSEVRIDTRANAVYIDTGACAGNKLSCAIVENNKIVEVISEKTNAKDIAR